VLLGGGVMLASVALHFHDPHQSGSWGYCPWYLLTGTYCPGCGGLRAVNDLTHGDVLAAASSNLALVVVLPFAVAGLLAWVAARWRGVPLRVGARVAAPVGWSALALLAVFTVLRNLPGSWLAP
jgi:hypothetical protein